MDCGENGGFSHDFAVRTTHGECLRGRGEAKFQMTVRRLGARGLVDFDPAPPTGESLKKGPDLKKSANEFSAGEYPVTQAIFKRKLKSRLFVGTYLGRSRV